MSRVLMVYGSDFGQTERIVRRMAFLLGREGHDVTVWKGDAIPDDAALDVFDGYVVAGSVIRGRHQKYLRDFVVRHADWLNRSPSAFISVCGALHVSNHETRREARGYVEAFLKETGWHPQLFHSFAGALNYTVYPLMLRLVMRFISWRNGAPTDTSRDYDFTDWDAVERVTKEMAVGFAELATATR